jgi:hypothetical protein
MTEEITRKLTSELNAGIETEVQLVYLLAQIRKLIERDDLFSDYPRLNFHCDWALHSKLDRAHAKGILQLFDAAQPLLKAGMDLPRPLQSEIDEISKMLGFERELANFLEARGLPPIAHDVDGWSHFLHLYTQVIQDIPLLVKPISPDAAQNISKVVVHFEAARETLKSDNREDFLYRIVWEIFDKNGETGTLSIYNSFDIASASKSG